MESEQKKLSDIAGDYFNQFLDSISQLVIKGNKGYADNEELIAEKVAGRLTLLLPECTITVSSIDLNKSELGSELHDNADINILMQCIDSEFYDGNVIAL
jgi:hypothetical protein